jgi:hypothetical protein
VQANAATQIDNAPHGNPLSLFSTKDMGGNVKRATYGVKWKDGAMTYTNIELVCGENKARDIGYSDDGTGTVWKDRSNDLYNGKKHYDLVKGSIQSNVYRVVCKSTNTQVAKAPVTVQSPVPQTSKAITLQSQIIGVKGLDLGMDKEAFTATFNKKVYEDGSAGIGAYIDKFSIAGTEGKYGSVNLTFTKEGKLGDLLFFFRPLADYDQIKEALATKYKLNCKQSVVSNALRQQFDQEICVFNNTQGDNLTLTKRLDRDTGTLTMTSKAMEIQRQNETKATIASAKKDI